MGETGCVIWGTPVKGSRLEDSGNLAVFGSARAGGSYRISLDAGYSLESADITAKARLTTWLVDQRNLGITFPLVTQDIAERIASLPVLSAEERAIRLLRFLAHKSPKINQAVTLLDDSVYVDNLDIVGNLSQELETFLEGLAWSESTESSEINFLIDYLWRKEWIGKAGLQQSDNVIRDCRWLRANPRSSDKRRCTPSLRRHVVQGRNEEVLLRRYCAWDCGCRLHRHAYRPQGTHQQD